MSAQHVVTAACVVAKTSSETGEGYFYRDAILPAGVPAAEKRRLVEAGLVKVVDAVVVDVVVTEPPPGEPGTPDVDVVVTEPPVGGPVKTDEAPRRTRPPRPATEA